ncbi:membrane protein [Microbacterium phage McGalleon]|uniref:Membrane protein n=1 Tax=Microbacterium phage McGalleon TaxID=2590936 RepID=A0A516KQW5_9CAUD|nr:membrane protein [Microbacterium phage McGalleon]QDP44086.1 membrane protein [Microbacterium phage McGalleon]
MKRIIAILITIMAILVAVGWVTVAASPAASHPLAPTPTATTTVDVHGATPELPEWAQEYDTTWLIYPEGFRCYGTEGCPNDYLAIGGEVGPVLPDNVVYYDPAKHDCVLVQPADVTC